MFRWWPKTLQPEQKLAEVSLATVARQLSLLMEWKIVLKLAATLNTEIASGMSVMTQPFFHSKVGWLASGASYIVFLASHTITFC